LSAEEGLAEREKIRQQLLDGGIAEEHTDAIMRIVPYENGAHPKRADGGETHNYPNKRKVAVTASKENDKNTRKKVEDQSKLLAKLHHNENVSNNEIIELLKAQSKPPGPSHKKKKETGDSEMADASGGANEGGESRAQEDAAPLTLDAMNKVYLRSMGPSSKCHECGCVITDEAMRNVGTLPMTTRCLDCHKKQGNVAAATTICYSTSAPLSVTWVEVSKPIVLKPMLHARGTRRTDDDNICDVHGRVHAAVSATTGRKGPLVHLFQLQGDCACNARRRGRGWAPMVRRQSRCTGSADARPD
jgi:hypothetical protein